MTIATDIGAERAPARRIPASFSRDFVASIVVFLVAMPLCMGIAVASGVSPEKGLITGVIGGVVVGAIAGSPLQVSGPAAGLAVIVFEIVRNQGLSALGPILLVAGAIQVLAGVCRLGQWFRAISPAVVHGMLAGIGALIVFGQLHVLLDRTPLSSGVANLAAIPDAFISLSPLTIGQAEAAFAVGASTILTIWLWEKFRPKSLKLMPGALVGVLVGTGIAALFTLDVKKVVAPESIMGALSFPDFGRLAEPAILTAAVAIAFIASAETLLSAAAVDRMHNGVRTKYNKELVAQGVGNTLCGFLGGLPMTGVIVRSSANVQAGAATRLSTMLHGMWILGLVALLPFVLEQIPMAALAGVLVVTGWKLISLKHVRHLFHQYGLLPAIIWTGTFVMVVATDLLMGVLVGLALSLLELIPFLRRPRLAIKQRAAEDEAEVELSGAATFLQLPKLTATLESLPAGKPVRLILRGLNQIDHTSAEMLADWLERRRLAGARIELDPDGAAKHQRFAVAAGG
jgi:MFS superfamily sulfate permease-like transporter